MKRLLKLLTLLIFPALLWAQHPVAFFTKTEANAVKASLNKYPLLNRSYTDIKKEVDSWLGKKVDVPFPKDPAGGYTHDQHKFNYMLMFNSGILYQLTNDSRYATLVKNIFLDYAKLNPTLGKHPQATSSSPGHIFWQALNDANWLVYTGMAYDLIYNTLTASEKKIIEDGAFKPEVDYLTKDLSKWFNLIHNHGVWACAGVGIVGIATQNKEYVDMALYGTSKNGKSGFIAQMDGLFAPDGYYTEGPYYVRYAILPYYLFANALNNAQPQLKIFEHRERVLQKALLSALQLTNLDGTFYALNDALKEKDYTSNELVTSIGIAWNVYGKNSGMLVVAKKQDRVLLNKGGASIAAALSTEKNIPAYYPYESVEYVDGVKGDEGGVSVLRNGKGKDLTSLIYKYSAHGLSHGHFDKLTYNLYDKGNEILSDYGSVRFIGVEQKYGGRYLPENDQYASQTIAHNTITIDETSHYDGDERKAEKAHPVKLFSNIQPPVQVVAAKESSAYAGTNLQRSVYQLLLPTGKKLVVDLFTTSTSGQHQFDLPFHYNGHLISTSFRYKPFTKQQEVLGSNNGYQFLWKEAEAVVTDSIAQLTFLNDRTYYTVSTLADGETQLFLTRSGANDPNFNLRHEPAFIIRKKGTSRSFLNVVETHGKFDPIIEFSTNAYASVKGLKWLQQDEYLVAEILVEGKKLVIAQSANEFDRMKKHTAQGLSWAGPYAVWYDGKLMK